MITATQFLNKRLEHIAKHKHRIGEADITPTIADIEQTHIIYVAAHFKPHAAIAYEYDAIRADNGASRFGQQIQFNINQFGDFFNDMVLKLTVSETVAANADYWEDPVANPARGAELLQYVDNVGERIIESVKFAVNQNSLDEYDSDITAFHNKFCVTPNKRAGWDIMVCQQRPIKAYHSAPMPDPTYQSTVDIYDGLQTPKKEHPEFTLWIPLLFWFNKDVTMSIPSICIPYGRRYVIMQIARINQILQHKHAYDSLLDSPATNPVITPEITECILYVNNLFMNPEIHDIYIKKVGFSLIRVYRKYDQSIRNKKDQSLLVTLKWPIETLYVGFRPADNTDTAKTTMLKGWNKYAHIDKYDVELCGSKDYVPLITEFDNGAPTVADFDAVLGAADGLITTAFGKKILSLEEFFNVPGGSNFNSATINLTVNNQQLGIAGLLNYWSAFYGLPQMDLDNSSAFVPTAAELNAAWRAPPTAAGGSGTERCTATAYECVPIVKTIGINAHSVKLYENIPEAMFNHYIPYTFGGRRINTPDECGVYMITFNLHPGKYNPSGHINTSRAREFYILWESDVIGTETVPSADLVVIGVAINFLLISEGSAILRYTT